MRISSHHLPPQYPGQCGDVVVDGLRTGHLAASRWRGGSLHHHDPPRAMRLRRSSGERRGRRRRSGGQAEEAALSPSAGVRR
ncbi:Os02g0730775 [Oryza sativa Japonica Group]|uniref:Os02g0730775 protein n=1 Tax=Oryza sativa subsp. japonica TaxID=39947 RepID=A0A0P0VPJ2_ORYSJ|nr:hypothetical protein EE612_013464 [Oryza sativa]BAS80751.1 Os02g0730775 [Oryza sativa Japonica Group]